MRSLISLGIIGLLLSPLALVGETSKHSAVTPAPRGNDWWKQRADLLNQNVKETPDTQLIFIGDSITQGWEGAGKEVWAERYASHKAVNLGIGGDRTQHVLYRLHHGNLKGIAPKVAVVMIGTNNSNGYDNTAGQIAAGVAAIVKTLRTKVPQTKVLLLGIFPRGENINEQRGKLLQINQILAKYDDGEYVKFLDIGHHFITEQGLIPAEIMPDYLHLSPKGYEIWADAIAPYLQGWLNSGKDALADSPVLGKWTFVIQGPDENDVEMPLNIELNAGKLSGFIGSEDRRFPLKNTKIDGDKLEFTVTRDRPNGGTMSYKLQGAFKDDKLEGKVSANLNGEDVEQTWRARRRTE